MHLWSRKFINVFIVLKSAFAINVKLHLLFLYNLEKMEKIKLSQES